AASAGGALRLHGDAGGAVAEAAARAVTVGGAGGRARGVAGGAQVGRARRRAGEPARLRAGADRAGGGAHVALAGAGAGPAGAGGVAAEAVDALARDALIRGGAALAVGLLRRAAAGGRAEVGGDAIAVDLAGAGAGGVLAVT